jgi:peptidoglycan/LPS O-acetylase OafA/YrhL
MAHNFFSERGSPMTIPKKPPLAALTSLRFFAALAIVVHHCNGVFWPAATLGPLDVGVSFFFVLSGFILTYVYGDPAAGTTQWRAFYRARLARIWPLHLVCLVLTLLLVNVPEPFNAGVLLANALLLHAWIPFDRYFFSYNYVSWSISTELFFYLLFPVMVVHARHWLGRTVLLALLMVLVLALVSHEAGLLPWQTTHYHLSSTGLLYTNPLARFAEFASGIVAAMLFQRSRPQAPASRRRWTLIELAGIGFFLLGYRYFLLSFAPVIHEALLSAGATRIPLAHLADEAALLMQVSPMAAMLVSEWANHVGLTPFALLLIMVFAYQRGALSALLSQRWLVRLGEISFALYLVHQLVLRFVQQQGMRTDAIGFAVFIVSIMLLALALHRLVEQPARRWLTR